MRSSHSTSQIQYIISLKTKVESKLKRGCLIYTLLNYCNWDTNPNSLRNFNVLKSCSGLHKVLMDKFSFTIFTSWLIAHDRLILTIKVWLAIHMAIHSNKHMNSTLHTVNRTVQAMPHRRQVFWCGLYMFRFL